MAIEVTKKPGEPNRALLRRFKRRVQQSGLLIDARKNKFRERESSKREQKQRALKRIEIGKKKEKLRKMGLLEDASKKRR